MRFELRFLDSASQNGLQSHCPAATFSLEAAPDISFSIYLGSGRMMKQKITGQKMRTIKLFTLLAVLAPSVSSAEIAFTDMYVGGFAGAVFGVDAKGEGSLPLGTASLDFDPDGQYALGLVFGARVAPNFRAEVELSYSNSDVDETNVNGNYLQHDHRCRW